MAAQPAAPRPAQPLRPRHVPQRTCVGCRTTLAKRQLVRIVRLAEGGVRVDPSGRLPGRGAYLHLDRRCWNEGLTKGRLARALHVSIPAGDQAELARYLTENVSDVTPEAAPLASAD